MCLFICYPPTTYRCGIRVCSAWRTVNKYCGSCWKTLKLLVDLRFRQNVNGFDHCDGVAVYPFTNGSEHLDFGRLWASGTHIPDVNKWVFFRSARLGLLATTSRLFGTTGKRIIRYVLPTNALHSNYKSNWVKTRSFRWAPQLAEWKVNWMQILHTSAYVLPFSLRLNTNRALFIQILCIIH